MQNATDTILRLTEEMQATTFEIMPTAPERAAIAEGLGVNGIKKLRFSGTVVPDGKTDWRLEGSLGATVVQTCVVTLDPVTTRVDVPVLRRFVESMPEIEDASEVEMPEDDSLEPLTDTIDLARIATEALALAIPDFPRAEGVDPVEISVTEPGKKAMSDDEAKPFAGLAALKDSMKDTGDEED